MLRLTSEERRVLSFIQFRARAPISLLSKELDLRAHRVRYIVDKFEERSVITPLTRIDVQALGLKQYSIWCTFSSSAPDNLSLFYQEAAKIPSISWVGIYCGEYDLMLGMHAREDSEVDAAIAQLVGAAGPLFSQMSRLQERYWVTYEKKHFFDSSVSRTSEEVVFLGKRSQVDFDSLDFKILGFLAEAPFLSLTQLSQRLGVPTQTLHYRVGRLEASRVLLGGAYSIRHRELGIGAFGLLVKVACLTPEFERNLRNYCRLHRNIVGMGRYSGEWDFELYVESGDAHELHMLRLELLKVFGMQIHKISIVTLTRVQMAECRIGQYQSLLEQTR